MPAGDCVTDADCDYCAKVKREKSPSGRQRAKLKGKKKKKECNKKVFGGFVADGRQMSAASTFAPEGRCLCLSRRCEVNYL